MLDGSRFPVENDSRSSLFIEICFFLILKRNARIILSKLYGIEGDSFEHLPALN